MLNFRPLQVAKRKFQQYNQIPSSSDLEDASSYADGKYDDSDDDVSSYLSPTSSNTPYSSRASSGIYDSMLRTQAAVKPTVSAYSYRNPRAFTRYFALAIGSTIILFMVFLVNRSAVSAKSVEQGLEKPPPPPPVWESFPFLKRYHGGIRTLVRMKDNVPEYPTKADVDPEVAPAAKPSADDTQKLERRKSPQAKPDEGEKKGIPFPSELFDPFGKRGDGYQECFLDVDDSIRIPSLRAYPGVTEGMPENIVGSYDVLGLRNDVCFERFGRLGPYGLGYSRKFGGTGAGMEGDREGIEDVWKPVPEVDFTQIRWGKAQKRCEEKNRFRFNPKPKGRNHFFKAMSMESPEDELPESTSARISELKVDGTNQTVHLNTTTETKKAMQKQLDPEKLLPRTCVLIRTWWDYQYDEEDIIYLRALIAELAIQSGGEYTVHFLIHVKDDNKQIWADEEVYQEVLKNSLPEEFAGMGTLWSERQMGLIYGGLAESMYRNLPVHGAYRSTYMPVTYFAHQHPEFDFIWNWEMDVRYTGHFYHLFHQVSEFAKKQPRKLLWERSGRFYVPHVHGSWDDFSQMVRVQTEHGTNNKANTWSSHLPPNPHVQAETELQKPEKSIWGPDPPLDYPDIELDEKLMPKTTYAQDRYEWGVGEDADIIVFNPLFDPAHTNWILAEDVTGYNTTQGLPPRRTAINTSGRLSRRLLMTMHREQSIKRHSMFSEMWPSSVALHHGYKAVYAPHPVFMDRKWPVQYLAAIFNNGRNGASGGARLSVFSDERQHNFRGSSWYYDAGFAGNLWRRWMGLKVDNDGGELEEVAGEGRMCLPGVLLHPVKQVDLGVVDVQRDKEKGE